MKQERALVHSLNHGRILSTLLSLIFTVSIKVHFVELHQV